MVFDSRTKHRQIKDSVGALEAAALKIQSYYRGEAERKRMREAKLKEAEEVNKLVRKHETEGEKEPVEAKVHERQEIRGRLRRFQRSRTVEWKDWDELSEYGEEAFCNALARRNGLLDLNRSVAIIAYEHLRYLSVPDADRQWMPERRGLIKLAASHK